jgi:hypothetical protein
VALSRIFVENLDGVLEGITADSPVLVCLSLAFFSV